MAWGTDAWGSRSWGSDATPLTVNGIIRDSDGNPMTNGYIDLVLSGDARAVTNFVPGGITVRINLDANGRVAANQAVMGNDVMTPSTLVYVATGYKSTGQLAFKYPHPFTVTGTSFDLSAI